MVSLRRKPLLHFLCSAAVTIALLEYAFSHFPTNRFSETLLKADWRWLLLSLLLFLTAIGIGGARFHLALSLSRSQAHIGASLRTVFSAYWGYILGALGGDGARVAIYCKSFDGNPLQVTSAVMLDRFAGIAGLLFLVLLSSFLDSSGLGPFLAVFVLIFIALNWRKIFSGMAARAQVKLDNANPSILGRCLLLGILTQFLVASSFYFNILALSPFLSTVNIIPYIPWVMLCSAFPFAVAGLGLREGAAVYFFGLAGLPPHLAVASALLTFLSIFIATLLSAAFCLFLSRRPLGEKLKPSTISVVIPVFNEEKVISSIVSALLRMDEVVEVIVVDGGSTDSTHQLAVSCGAKVLSSQPGRGLQLRLGAEAARGDIIWMVHADMEIPPHSTQAILRSFRDSRVVAGGFWKTFQERRFLLFGSRIRCFIRLVLFRRLMADQAIFVSRQALVNIGGVPPMPLMEEFELCRLLRREGVLCLAGATVKTSARRFLKHGIITTYATMASVTLRYFLGESPENLKKLYEKK